MNEEARQEAIEVLQRNGMRVNSLAVIRMMTFIGFERLADPYARAMHLWNVGHRGPWHAGFWRGK